MYVIRPILRHFALWLILLPVVFIESRAFREFVDKRALDDPTRTNKVIAEVTEYREGQQYNEMEIRYRFQVNDSQTWYSAADMTGRRNLWVPVTGQAWQDIVSRGQSVDVLYLRNNPWVNKPLGKAGIPVLDSLCGWLWLLVIDAYSIRELIIMIRNYLRCRRAAERGELCRLKYWETRSL